MVKRTFGMLFMVLLVALGVSFHVQAEVDVTVTPTDPNNAEPRRDEISIVVADEYYKADSGAYPLQIEVMDTKEESTYTMSVYEGEALLAKDLNWVDENSHNYVKEFLVENFTTEAGSRTFTFVAKEDGVEAARLTKEVIFREYPVYFYDDHIYRTADMESTTISGYCYGYTSPVETLEVLNAEGECIYSGSPSSYLTYYSDYRYDGIFSYNSMETDCIYFSVSIQLNKYWEEGIYDIRLTLEDGTVLLEEDIMIVTMGALLLNYYPSNNYYYSTSYSGEYAYITVMADNMDWGKVWPVIYDRDDNLVSELVEYKQIMEEVAIYKLRRTVDKPWNNYMKIVLDREPGYVIVDDDADWDHMMVISRPFIYYAEQMVDSGKVRVVCDNLEDGKEYSFTIAAYDNKKVILGECAAVLEDGVAELEFKNVDGSAFTFDMDVDAYEVACVYEEDKKATGYFINVMAEVASRSYYKSIQGVKGAYVNDGRDLVQTCQLNTEVLKEDAVLTAKLLDANNELIAESGAITKEVSTALGDGRKIPVWDITITFEGLTLENEKNYWLQLLADGTTCGRASVKALNPGKPYYASIAQSYDTENTLVMEVEGYFPEELDKDKIGIRLLDREKKLILECIPTNVEEKGRAGTSDEKLALQFDFSEHKEVVADYTTITYQVTYDSQDMDYAYQGSFKGDFNKYSGATRYLMTEGIERAQQIDGIYIGDRSGVTAYVYLPYRTEVLAEIHIPEGTTDTYMFTTVDVAGLDVNHFETKYDVVLKDREGRFLDWQTGYLKAEEVWPFVDVPEDESNWQYIAVEYVYYRGIMTGTSYTTFEPDVALTREMLVQMLYSLEGKPEVTFKDTFTDVAEGLWYSDAVIWAAENNITAGLGDGRFGVGTAITREQLALMLFQYANQAGYDITGEASLDDFEDAENVNTWSKDALEWAVNMGIVSGKPTDTGMLLDPQGDATRAECAAMMRRFCMNYID